MKMTGELSQAVPSTEPGSQHSIFDLEVLIKEFEKLPVRTDTPCILKIPQKLREVNPKAYTPTQVAIGPYHADVTNLKSMEPHKLRYLHSLLLRSRSLDKLEDYIAQIERTESDARKCYSGFEELHINSETFKRMLLIDGAFILEFFFRNVGPMFHGFDCDDAPLVYDSDPTYENGKTRSEICQDLILLENQLPYFVLEALFHCTFSSTVFPMTLPQLAYACLSSLIPNRSNRRLFPEDVEERTSAGMVMHLVHLMRMCCLDVPEKGSRDGEKTRPSRSLSMKYSGCYPPTSRIRLTKCTQLGFSHLPLALQSCRGRKIKKQRQGIFRYYISVSELRRSGIRFEWNKEEESIISIKFNAARGVVQMPSLILDKSTELFFRNVMAFEQYHLDEFEVTNYMCFMDGLIDTTRDVQILEGSHVIDNWLESKEGAAAMINNIGSNHIVRNYGDYIKLSNELRAYATNPWNKWRAMLHRDYFGSPWAIISFIAAVVLLGLTAVQTAGTIRSTNWH